MLVTTGTDILVVLCCSVTVISVLKIKQKLLPY
jgi:hypothetical protein